MQPISHYRQKFRERGLASIIYGRMKRYKQRILMDNWFVGKFVELTGNRVKLQNVILFVDNPLVTTRHKGLLFFGKYEEAGRELCTKYIDRSLATVEIGGSIGGVACITNKLLDNPARHVVLEGNPILIPTLETNRNANGTAFIIEPYAISYQGPTITFTISDNFMLGGVQTSQGREIKVATISLRDIIEKHRLETINLISDCEGAEVDLIENEPDILRDHVKWLIVETHEINVGSARLGKMMADLDHLGFRIVERSRETVLVLRNSGIS